MVTAKRGIRLFIVLCISTLGPAPNNIRAETNSAEPLEQTFSQAHKQFAEANLAQNAAAPEPQALKSRIIQTLLDDVRYHDLIIQANEYAEEIGLSGVNDLLRPCSERQQTASQGNTHITGLAHLSIGYFPILRSVDEIADSTNRQLSESQITQKFEKGIQNHLAQSLQKREASLSRRIGIKIYPDFLWVETRTFDPNNPPYICFDLKGSVEKTAITTIHELIHFVRFDPFQSPDPLRFNTPYEYMKAIVWQRGSEVDAYRAEIAMARTSGAASPEAFKSIYSRFSINGQLNPADETQFVDLILRKLHLEDHFQETLRLAIQFQQWLQEDILHAIKIREQENEDDPQDDRILNSIARLRKMLDVSKDRLSRLQALMSSWEQGAKT